MTIKEFKKSEMCKKAKSVKYLDVNGVNISKKPSIILDLLQVIGTGITSNGEVEVDVAYME